MEPLETDHLDILKKEFENLLKWGSSKNWGNDDFKRLSELILAQTNVNLSISTLKRLWGKVRYNSIPSLTTLNAMAKFVGRESWRQFCSENIRVGKAGFKNVTPVVTTAAHFKLTKFLRNSFLLLLIVLTPMYLIWMSLFSTGKKRVGIDRSHIVFTSKKVSEELPNSVVFNYDLGNISTNNVVIQQSWDATRQEKVLPGGHQHTSIYYYPGFFMAKLLVDDRIVSEHEILIKTAGWKGIIETKPFPVYLDKDDIGLNGGGMGISARTLNLKTGLTVFNDFWTGFYNIGEFYKVNPGNFRFSAILQNKSSKKEALCKNTEIFILTSDGLISLPLCSLGCTSAISLYLADHLVDGKDNDLSAFGCDFSKSQMIDCIVKNKTIRIYLNQKEIFSSSYNRPLGRIVGVIVRFEGAGEIENLSIQ